MPGAVHFRHRDDLLPGALVSACAYTSSGMPEGEHRGLSPPWITFIVSADSPVRVSGTVDERDRFDPSRATSYDVCVAGLHPVAARVEDLARAFRSDNVISQLADGSQTLADVAASTGYADRAHLAREFHAMAGCAPTQWLVEERRDIQDGGHLNRPDSTT